MLEPVRRIEVFTGAGRRRTWPAEVKARIVAESYGAGETVCAVARRHGLTAQQLFTWRRKARRRGLPAGDTEVVSFAPVVMDRAAMPNGATPSASPADAAAIEVVIGDAVVRAPRGVDASTLTIVLRAVKAVS